MKPTVYHDFASGVRLHVNEVGAVTLLSKHLARGAVSGGGYVSAKIALNIDGVAFPISDDMFATSSGGLIGL